MAATGPPPGGARSQHRAAHAGRGVAAGADEGLDDSGERIQEVFASYRSCVQQGCPHPGDVAEASSLR